MNRCLQEADVPEWMTKNKTILIQKDSPQRNCSKQLLTAQIMADNSLMSRGLFPEEQKGCQKWARKDAKRKDAKRSTGELLYIYQHILKK